jgi:hypothetical protein
MLKHPAARTFALATNLLLVAACSTSAQQPKTPGPSDVVATVGTVSITLQQVDQKALQEPAASFGNMKLSQAIFEARRAATDEIVGDLLLDQEAKRRSVERNALYSRRSRPRRSRSWKRTSRRGISRTRSASRGRRSNRTAPRFSRSSPRNGFRRRAPPTWKR